MAMVATTGSPSYSRHAWASLNRVCDLCIVDGLLWVVLRSGV
jgi:hypothetical protein